MSGSPDPAPAGGGEADVALAGLLLDARGGSGEALGRLLEGCRGYLLFLANRAAETDLQAKAGASDLVQQTLLEGMRDFPQFRGTSAQEFRLWLRRLLVTNLANFRRSYRGTAKRAASLELPLNPLAGSSDTPGVEPAADDSSPSEQAIRAERAAALWRAVDQLPPDYREVVRLRKVEQLGFEEIGARLGRTANAARLLFLRAVDRLAAELVSWEDSR
jgi:RNA polymerase sigma-70 factor (ECF subfamily)